MLSYNYGYSDSLMININIIIKVLSIFRMILIVPILSYNYGYSDSLI